MSIQATPGVPIPTSTLVREVECESDLNKSVKAIADTIDSATFALNKLKDGLLQALNTELASVQERVYDTQVTHDSMKAVNRSLQMEKDALLADIERLKAKRASLASNGRIGNDIEGTFDNDIGSFETPVGDTNQPERASKGAANGFAEEEQDADFSMLPVENDDDNREEGSDCTDTGAPNGIGRGETNPIDASPVTLTKKISTETTKTPDKKAIAVVKKHRKAKNSLSKSPKSWRRMVSSQRLKSFLSKK